jgi:hypothetical protein
MDISWKRQFSKEVQIANKYILKYSISKLHWDSISPQTEWLSSRKQTAGVHTCNTKEAEIRRIVQSQPWANSSWDPILKIPNTKKSRWSISSSKSTYLAHMRPWVQTAVPQKQKKQTNKKKKSKLPVGHYLTRSLLQRLGK